jgi:two-component system sensor histidine kinase PrrB
VRSLRSRLTFGVIAVLGAILLLAGTLASREVNRSERAALDDRLERTAELSRAAAVTAVEEELPETDRRLDAVLRGSQSSLRLVVNGLVLLDPGERLPRDPARGVRGLHTFTARGERYRTLATTVDAKNLGGLARLEVTTRLGPLERRQAALGRRLAGLGLLALALAGIGVWLAASLLLRPLRRLRAVTAGVAGDEDLGRRVPDDDGPAELRSLARSFNAMLARLGRSAADRERALAATRRFTADAGHELRTPLTSVRATLSALGRHPDMPAPMRARMVGDAMAEQQRLVALLDGLQSLARGDAQAVRDTDVDLAEIVDAEVASATARHPTVDLAADVPAAPVVVRGWEPGLRLTTGNLIENAARHGRPGGQIRVTLSPADPATGGGPRLVVEDDGEGVPEEQRSAIFEPFARLGDGERPGSGLGLALVAQQARHHQAAVDVDGSPTLGGARFTVRFGAGQGAGDRAPVANEARPAGPAAARRA